MRRPFRFIPAVIVGACMVGVASGQNGLPREKAAAKRSAPSPAEEQEKARKLQVILKQWERQSAGLTSLDVRFTRKDVSPAWDGDDGPTQYRGRALLLSPDKAILRLEKLEREKGQERYTSHEDIICTGQHVLQYAYPTRQIFVFPLAREARQRVLEEGPLPFLFNMRVAEMESRFRMKLARETADAYVIEVHPLLDYDKESFIGAHLWLNKRSLQPQMLRFYERNGKDHKEYTFSAIHTNPKLDPKLFRGRNYEGWTIVENPGPDPTPPRGASRPVRRTPR